MDTRVVWDDLDELQTQIDAINCKIREINHRIVWDTATCEDHVEYNRLNEKRRDLILQYAELEKNWDGQS